MNNLTQSELSKVDKASLHEVTLSSDMKISVVDKKLKDLCTKIKNSIRNKTLRVFLIEI